MPAVGKGIYTIPGGLYLNREVLGQVHRKAFMYSAYNGSPKRALDAAKEESEFFDEHKELIAAVLPLVKPGTTDEQLHALAKDAAGFCKCTRYGCGSEVERMRKAARKAAKRKAKQ